MNPAFLSVPPHAARAVTGWRGGLGRVGIQVFVQGYIHSIVRSSVVPVAMRGAGFKVGPLVQALTHHVQTGQRPADALARLFLR